MIKNNQSIEQYLLGKTFYDTDGHYNYIFSNEFDGFKVYYSIGYPVIYQEYNAYSPKLLHIINEIKNISHEPNDNLLEELTNLFPEYII